MKTQLFFLPLCIMLLSACNNQPHDYQSLRAERDSLIREKETMKAEMESYFATINLIELNIEKIKNAEKLITLQPLNEENEIDSRNKIHDDLTFINEMLKANREEINLLKNKLRKSNYQFAELDRTITRLTKTIEEEAFKVKALQDELGKKDSLITQLNVNIEGLSADIETLESEKKEQITKIKEQDETIHTVWYVFGTKKELKEQKIITSDGWFRPNRVLENDFNKNYFVRIDARKTKSIPLYSCKVKILSTHPISSYTLQKEDGVFTLLITDADKFWHISKYLVIEVD